MFPTIERTSIDFHGALLGDWNRALLQAAGTALRHFYSHSVLHDAGDPQSKHRLLRLLSFKRSAPSPVVRQQLRDGFFRHPEGLKVSLDGAAAVPLSRCRAPQPGNADQVLEAIKSYRESKQRLPISIVPSDVHEACGFFRQCSKLQLCKPLDQQDLVAIFSRITLADSELPPVLEWLMLPALSPFRSSHLSCVSIRDRHGLCRPLASIKRYALPPLTPGVALPPDALSLDASLQLPDQRLRSFSWSPLTFRKWAEWLVKLPSPALAASFAADPRRETLAYLARHHPFCLPRGVLLKLVAQLAAAPCIPTDRGLMLP
ncbi:MAG TPA: DUF3684 domain-containing protein, partial [archaeon]|nr:DUF3684 domain-containing protein [archaeon]